jgi:signal transduction histidine kinase
MKYRYSLVLAAFIIINLIIYGIFVSTFTNQFNNAETRIDSSLIVRANEILVFSEENLDNINRKNVSSKINSMLDENGFNLKIYSLDGSVLFNSTNAKGFRQEKESLNEVLSEINSKEQIPLSISDGHQMKALAVFSTDSSGSIYPGLKKNGLLCMGALFASVTLLIIIMFTYFYIKIIKPFRNLENFSEEIARGNFDIPLPMEKTNIFGAFTWAFDLMRIELKKARESELEAQKAKKELIATLSHDIKTPVSSIKAYAEGLVYNMDNSSERRNKYLKTIMKKSDEVTQLVNDLFLHAITDLEKLEISPMECYSKEVFEEIIGPYQIQIGNRLKLISEIPNVLIWTDKKRLTQVVDNIISNSLKYAPEGDLEISTNMCDGFFEISFIDSGKGIAPEELPFVFEKFFRGKAARENGIQGTGLGLYVSKYIMDKTGGYISVHNVSTAQSKGLCVIIGIEAVNRNTDI